MGSHTLAPSVLKYLIFSSENFIFYVDASTLTKQDLILTLHRSFQKLYLVYVSQFNHLTKNISGHCDVQQANNAFLSCQ